MNFSNTKIFFTSSILIPLAILSYVNFLIYKPKILRAIQEVKGARTESAGYVPLPDSYTEIRSDTSLRGRQITISVGKSPKEIQKFYKNLFLSDGWKIETEIYTDVLYSTKFKKDKENIVVTSAAQDGQNATIVSIDVVNLK